jgi:4-amino-4-deoxy-L-arabinose transferase-like glycosyltransferase
LATITPRVAQARPPRGAGLRAGEAVTARLSYLALTAILVLSGLLEFVKLRQNGFANIYYSAAVKSMLRSWHNFFFITADPNGLITVDKPPLGLWLQALSARVFGFSPLSLLIPEGVCAVLTVALMYRVIAPRFGRLAALAAALALAVFPSFVAVSRDNGVDPLLLLLMLATCAAGLAAVETGRLRTLIGCAVLAGLAFNTKSLAALLCVPGIGLAYLVCAPGSPRRRLAQLAAAGVIFIAIAVSWSLAVDLTPASQRPFVGSTSSNSELQLEFGYNGLGRVGGQQGGPGSTRRYLTASQTKPLVRPGIDAPSTAAELHFFASHRGKATTTPRPARRAHAATRAPGRHRLTKPVPFGGTRSPVRVFGRAIGGQAGWLVPLALIGMLALALCIRGRGDRRLAGLFVLGGWFVLELLVIDFSAGIVHPYYSSALGPGVAAMVGTGAAAIGSLVGSPDARRALRGYVLAVIAVGGTLAVELVLIDREGDPVWWRIPLVVLCLVGLAVIPLARSRSGWPLAVAVSALLVAPLIYSFSVWLAPVNGTFPVAGPYSYAGQGGYGVGKTTLRVDRRLIAYLRSHHATAPYQLLTQSSDQASPLILLGLRASADGGYNTTDPALSAGALARLVAEHRARYLLIAGPYASRGGNAASTAARLVCPEIPAEIWSNGISNGLGSYLVDCAGRARELRHPYRSARAFIAAYEAKYPVLRRYAL